MFTRQQNVTIATFEDISITLFVPGANNVSGSQSGTIEIQLILSDNSIKTIKSNLLTRLNDDATGQTHLTNLVSLRDYILTRIAAEVLPTP